MNHTFAEREDLPHCPPPRWMVSSHYWDAVQLREEQVAYEIKRSVDEIESITASIHDEIIRPKSE